MGVNLGNSNTQQSTVNTNTNEPIQDVAVYDIVSDKQTLAAQLANSPEVEKLTSTIDVSDMNTMVTFGAEVAENISRASDSILRSMTLEEIEKSSKLLVAINDIMKRFDIEEIKDEPGFFGKILGNAKKQLDKILAKYHSMGDEVDKIYIELKKYETEIKESNKKLQALFDSNVNYFHDLERYIVAGDQACIEISNYIQSRQADFAATGDNGIQLEINDLQQALLLLEQRTQDLRVAENVAMQSIPMIKTMQVSNVNLIRKINSAFIITLPVFKQALAQAILLKRQKIQAEAMSVLDEKTNELLIRNAQNTVDQAKLTTRLTSTSSIKVETLEQTWQTICNGIDETKAIQETARQQRVEDQKRLNQIKEDYKSKYFTAENK